jgi:hypothetical protein
MKPLRAKNMLIFLWGVEGIYLRIPENPTVSRWVWIAFERKLMRKKTG